MSVVKVDGWKSEYASVDNVLRHLHRKASGYGAPTYASAEFYGDVLSHFCEFAGKSPDQLLSLPKAKIEELIHSHLDQMLDRNLSKKTVKTRRSFLLLHFTRNGFRGNKALEIEVYTVPARYRKLPEYIPSPEEILKMADSSASLRDRAMILCMYTSGLRDSTMKALRYKDVKNDVASDIVLVPVYPEMKRIIHKACKNNIPYYTFFDPIASEALKAYLRDREAKLGPTEDEAILFPPNARAAHVPWHIAKFKPMAKNEMNRIVKRAARNAGLKEWMNVHPHCLRKSFEEAIKKRREDGTMLGEKDQEFIMGHILPGSQDPYYGSGIRVQGSAVAFKNDIANKLREEYRMVSFFPHRNMASKDEVLLTFNRQFLKYSGYADEEIDALGDLSQIPSQELQKLIDRKNMQRLGLSNGNHQKVVPMEEVKKWIGEGWEFTAALPSGEAIIKLPTH